MVAFPPPPVTLRQRSSTFVEPHRSLRRVLASGCHSFLSEWLEKVSQPSLAEPFGSNQGVNRINSRLSLLSLGVTAPIADPCLGLESRNLRDREVYTPMPSLDQISVCFIFCANNFLIANISSSFLYFVLGQKNPFNPSFLRRGTTCTCK